jgi:hypothetical protein
METVLKNHNHREGKVAKSIEKQTSKLPSDWFLWTALGALGLAVTLNVVGKNHAGLLLGELASPILIMGLYNKLVKVEGHD